MTQYINEHNSPMIKHGDDCIFTMAGATSELNMLEARLRELEAANAAQEQTILALRGNLEYVQLERDELARQFERAQKALALIEDQAGRAALVQDRSVAIIKSACRLIAREAHEAQS